MSFLADLTPERIPVTGVYDSSNAVVYLAGLALLRVESVRAVISNNVARYPEVGSREQNPYRGQDKISVTINRAYVNGAEWRLAIGYDASVLSPGMQAVAIDNVTGYEQNISNLLSQKTHKTEGVNVYPVKTRIEMEINKSQAYRMGVVGGLDPTPTGKKMWLSIGGAMIDTVGIAFNNRGLITSGPITCEGETAIFRVKDFPT